MIADALRGELRVDDGDLLSVAEPLVTPAAKAPPALGVVAVDMESAASPPSQARARVPFIALQSVVDTATDVPARRGGVGRRGGDRRFDAALAAAGRCNGAHCGPREALPRREARLDRAAALTAASRALVATGAPDTRAGLDVVARGSDRFGARALGSRVLRRPKLSIAVSLLATGLAGYYAAGHLGVNTDTANMISPTLPWRRDFIEYRDAFPVRDRNLLIVIDAPSAVRADAFSAALLAELRKRPDLYHSILLQGEGEFFERNGLLYLPLAELEQLADRLAAAQPLLGLLQNRFDGAAVLDVATRTLEPQPDGAADGAAGAAVAALAPFYSGLAATLAAARAEGAALAAQPAPAPAAPRRPRARSLCSPSSTSRGCSRRASRSRASADRRS